ncbi:hypothetical protein LOC67_24880 [Stieleria sp. JC731]|uniref:hypothetical protein n=1 Tax=Pirellulaceae TaxID=2691357 RepID=UPI001E5DC862|nr:hypothetical protein [Stieleria sp. JC731]MCC9603799.1 hypothetical protein [Stieleria sp. JC731]
MIRVGASFRSVTLWAATFVLIAGCTGGLETQYGGNTGYFSQRSINGLTTFRNAFDREGFYTRDMTRLTERTRKVVSLVWTPAYVVAPESKTMSWIDRWLRQGGRTLVYVIPDSGSATDYYRQATHLAAPDQRMEYRRLYGESLIKEHQMQMMRNPVRFGNWFVIAPKVQTAKTLLATDDLRSSDWGGYVESTDNGETEKQVESGLSKRNREYEWVIESIDQRGAVPATAAGNNAIVQVLPNGSDANVNVAVGVADGSNAFGAMNADEMQFKTLVKTETGDSLVVKLTSKVWKDSQVIVLVGSSRLTNFGLTQPENQRLASAVIDEVKHASFGGSLVDQELELTADGEQPQVGFVVASEGLPVSTRVGEIPRATGAEMLTEFPLSMVTIHAAIIGFVICLILFPIFGRPRKVERGTLTHFGDHLDAVATLLWRRGGEPFARKRISEYMKQVRGETHGPWVIEEPKHQNSPAQHLPVQGLPAQESAPVAASQPAATMAPQASSDRPNESDQSTK